MRTRRRPTPDRRSPWRHAFVIFALAAALPVVAAGPVAGPVAAQEPDLPGLAAWRTALGPGRAVPEPRTTLPADVRHFFAGLPAGVAADLVREHPQVVGNLDGVPATLRYQANRAALRAAGSRFAGWAAPDRQILAFDPRGAGRVAEVVGDLDRAERVAVLVPGADVDLDTFATAPRRERAQLWKARTLVRAMRSADPRTPVAVVAWLGYDPPEGLGLPAARADRAAVGARALTRFVAGLRTEGRGPSVTVVCHSYGSVVCGLAAPRLQVRDLVAVGSPGMRVSSAHALGTRAQVWAARAAGDWTRFIPKATVFGVGHGADPAGGRFGARRFATAGAYGHDRYFTPGSQSLANLARIALGRYAEVTR